MKILGVSALYHDSAACFIKDGEIIAATQEERFTRKKHDSAFPIQSIIFCLDFAGVKPEDLDAIVFYEKPLIKFERLLETYYAFAPKGLVSFLKAMPVWLKEKIFLKKLVYKQLEDAYPHLKKRKKIKLLFPEHHLSHAASAFFPSPFEEAAIVTIDGVGEWTTASICYGNKNSISILKELTFPHSLGLLYSAFTYYAGFTVNSGEYKLMGLAPYGNYDSDEVKDFYNKIKTKLIDIKEDGSIWLNQEYFNYTIGLTMTNNKKWQELFGFPKREGDTELSQNYCDLALAIQKVTEDVVLKMVTYAKKITGSNNICLAGGVALNCVANGKIENSDIFSELFIQPASGDAGGALGAALAAYYIYFDKSRDFSSFSDKMSGSYLGPEFSDFEIRKIVTKHNAVFKEYTLFDEIADITSRLLAEGKVIGWFQGRMEFGPRALGNRSILGDARNPDMQKRLNLKIKYREGFRPFAPSVLFEDVNEYFELKKPSPYMLLVEKVRDKIRKKLPQNYNELSLREKLYFCRSDLPAITHIDFSARVQTVHRETNERYWKLINSFKQKTKCSVIINTSFNVRGEPIVCTPEDAYQCFMNTEMDYLVIGNYIFDKTKQPIKTESEKEKWKSNINLD